MRSNVWLVGFVGLVASACAGASGTVPPGIDRVAPTSLITTTTTTPAEPTTTVSAEPIASTTTAAPGPDAAPEREVTRGEGQPVKSSARLTGDGAPVFVGDFADPFVLKAGDTYYAYATNTFSAHVPVLRATSGERGAYLGDVLSDLPAWSEPGHVWAPSVSPVGDGYVLWYTTRQSSTGRQCISVARADTPEGPFVDDSSGPLICDLANGGSIDPSPIVDRDGSLWLLWKSDGNCCGLPTIIYSQPLSTDGMAVAGNAVELIRNDLWWEGDVVEGPTMAYGPKAYHLLYSANRWDTDDYAIGHATCDSIAGPCVKDADPWLISYDGAWGPGGPEFVPSPDGWAGLLVYHGWTASGIGYPNGARSLFVAKLRAANGAPIAPSFRG